jgi:hypothetical protein
LGDYLIQYLRSGGGMNATSPDVIIELDAIFFLHQKIIALDDFHKVVIKKWERFKKGFEILRI